MTEIVDEKYLVVRYLKSKKQVIVPTDIEDVDCAEYEPISGVWNPEFEETSVDGPGYETSVFVYSPEDGIDWNDGLNLFKANNNPAVPSFAVQTTVGVVKEQGLVVASQPLKGNAPHASIRGWSEDEKVRERQSDAIGTQSDVVIRPGQEDVQLQRAKEIVRQRNQRKKRLEKKCQSGRECRKEIPGESDESFEN